MLEPTSARASRPKPARPSLPVLATAALTGGLAWRGITALRSSHDLVSVVAAARHQLIGPVLLTMVVLVVVAERLWPAVSRPLLARGHRHDALYLIFYAAAVVPLVVLIGVGLSALLARFAPWLRLPAVGFAPHWVAFVATLVVLDGCNWLAHWANHRWDSLWRLHALHHSQPEMSILTSFRAHPLVHTSFLISVVPAYMLSADGVVPSAAIVVYLCLGTLPHANVDWSLGLLGRIVVSPAYHRRHHADGGRMDVNLGTVLTIWDVMSGRAVFPEQGRTPTTTGIPGNPIPLEQSRPNRTSLVFAAQLTEPLFARQPEWIRRLEGEGP